MLFRLSEVYKSYGGKEILRGVSFQINPDEKIGLVGRNGAVIARFSPRTVPDDPAVIQAIEKALH